MDNQFGGNTAKTRLEVSYEATLIENMSDAEMESIAAEIAECLEIIQFANDTLKLDNHYENINGVRVHEKHVFDDLLENVGLRTSIGNAETDRFPSPTNSKDQKVLMLYASKLAYDQLDMISRKYFRSDIAHDELKSFLNNVWINPDYVNPEFTEIPEPTPKELLDHPDPRKLSGIKSLDTQGREDILKHIKDYPAVEEKVLEKVSDLDSTRLQSLALGASIGTFLSVIAFVAAEQDPETSAAVVVAITFIVVTLVTTAIINEALQKNKLREKVQENDYEILHQAVQDVIDENEARETKNQLVIDQYERLKGIHAETPQIAMDKIKQLMDKSSVSNPISREEILSWLYEIKDKSDASYADALSIGSILRHDDLNTQEQ